MSEKKISVLVVDDHPMFRKGVVDAIMEASSVEVIGEAESGKEALSMVEKLNPAVVVLDIDMPGMDGLEVATRLLDRDPSQKVVLLSMHREQRILDKALQIGVVAYIVKSDAVEAIVDGITSAVEGRSYMSPSLAELIMQRRHRREGKEEEARGLVKLTVMERSILAMVAQNMTSKEIASELSISPLTVGTHRTNISKKLGLSGKTPLVNFALMYRDQILDGDG